MKIAEAMAEIKLANRKIQSQFEFIIRNLGREERLRDPFEKDGTTQAGEVKAARQSIEDLEKRVVALKMAINTANMDLRLTVEGINLSVAEWLIWRRDVLPVKKNNLKILINTIQNVSGPSNAPRRAYPGEQSNTPPVFLLNVSDKQVNDELLALAAIEERLDGQLSVLNATAEVAL